MPTVIEHVVNRSDRDVAKAARLHVIAPQPGNVSYQLVKPS